MPDVFLVEVEDGPFRHTREDRIFFSRCLGRLGMTVSQELLRC